MGDLEDLRIRMAALERLDRRNPMARVATLVVSEKAWKLLRDMTVEGPAPGPLAGLKLRVSVSVPDNRAVALDGKGEVVGVVDLDKNVAETPEVG